LQKWSSKNADAYEKKNEVTAKSGKTMNQDLNFELKLEKFEETLKS